MKAIRVVFCLLFLLAPTDETEAGGQYITIGTGGATGTYYPTGGAICRLLNRSRKVHGIRCSVESTAGSDFNLRALVDRDLDFGIVQSKKLYQAYQGTGSFSGERKFKGLRSVFSMQAEPFTVVARADSGIRRFKDLERRRVNIGNPGSDRRATMDAVMQVMGWSRRTFRIAAELNTREQAAALCENRVQAITFEVSHPSGLVKEVTSSCSAILVPVTGPEIDRLVREKPYYRHATIPGELYRGTNRDIPTFGVSATLVTTDKVPDYVVYHLVRALFENFDQFRKLHPAFLKLDRREMSTDGLSAPLHRGAVKYYKEMGMR